MCQQKKAEMQESTCPFPYNSSITQRGLKGEMVVTPSATSIARVSSIF